ncbi:MAG: wax ester/triacylglycerol synthase family O-acyltransferase [Rhodocyclaceae bacterium]|nr:wax ester/triacylglycerol synthase family O-acyltransferase [Rhodocyclaceae bacterium]
MKSLSGLDGSFLHLETEETPMHVASVHLFDKPPGYKGDFYQDVRHLIARNMDESVIFRRKLAPMPFNFSNPVWVEGDPADLDYHIRRVVLPAPGSQQQLEQCVAGLHEKPLDRSRPLWEVHVIDGLASGQAAYYWKVHHAVLDGAAGIQLAKTLYDLEPIPEKGRRADKAKRVPTEHPGLVQLARTSLGHDAGQIVRFLRHLPAAARLLAGALRSDGSLGLLGQLRKNLSFGPKTVLNVPITQGRTFAGLSIPLAEVKRMAAVEDAKANDVILALCSGALRRYLAKHGGIPRKPLVAAMPISVREAGNTDMNTQATMVPVSLMTHMADAVERLRAIRDAATKVKEAARRAKSVIPTDFPALGVPWVVGGLASLYGRMGLSRAIPPVVNLVISNVPGPPVTFHAAGLPMRVYWPLSIVEHGVGLNITVISYGPSLGFGIIAATAAVPDARPIAQALSDAYEELRARLLPAAEAPDGTGKRKAAAGQKASADATQAAAPVKTPARAAKGTAKAAKGGAKPAKGTAKVPAKGTAKVPAKAAKAAKGAAKPARSAAPAARSAPSAPASTPRKAAATGKTGTAKAAPTAGTKAAAGGRKPGAGTRRAP